MMRLEPGGLIGHHGVGGGVGFVEAVAGKFFQQIKDTVGLSFGNVVGFSAAGHEGRALLGHLLDFLFAHGPPQQVGVAEGIASEKLRGLHDLLLIDEDSVGFLGDLLEQGMLVFNFHLAVPPLDEIWNEVHGAGAVEGHQRGNVFHGGQLKFSAEVAHTPGFQLKHADRPSGIEEIVGLLVVEGQFVDIDFDVFGLLDHFAGVSNDGQRFEAEKIHLEQTQITYGVHGVLGDDGAVGVRLEWKHIDQRLGADDHGGSVDGGIARDILQHKGSIDQLAGGFLVVVRQLQVG